MFSNRRLRVLATSSIGRRRQNVEGSALRVVVDAGKTYQGLLLAGTACNHVFHQMPPRTDSHDITDLRKSQNFGRAWSASAVGMKSYLRPSEFSAD
jgi:hypothetical protein